MTDEQATGLCGKLEVNEQQPLCLYLSTSRFTSVATRAPATNQSYLVDLSAEKEVVSIRNYVMLELILFAVATIHEMFHLFLQACFTEEQLVYVWQPRWNSHASSESKPEQSVARYILVIAPGQQRILSVSQVRVYSQGKVVENSLGKLHARPTPVAYRSWNDELLRRCC